MSLPTLSVLPLIVLLLPPIASPAQSSTAPAPPNRITLDIVVTPKSGVPVTGLHQEDFTILDNGSPRPVATFQAIADPTSSANPTTGTPPLEIVLLIDAVNTTNENISVERKQIDAFLQANNGHLTYPMTLAVFTDTGLEMTQDFSTDGNILASELDQHVIALRTRRPDSQWAAQERIQLSTDTLNLLARKEAPRPGRKIILWISPGWPLLSDEMVNLQDSQMRTLYSQIANTSTLLRSGNITLYSVDSLGPGENVDRINFYQAYLKGITKPSQVELADLGLQVLAVQTGGLVLGPANNIAALLQHCMADTTAYYELSFDPPPAEHPNEYHSLQIKMRQPGLTARTRTGYYGQP